MSDCIKHYKNSLFLYEELINVKSGASRISETETSTNILLINFPKGWIIETTFARNTEKLRLWSQLDFRVADDPSFSGSDFHQSKLLHIFTLSIEIKDCGSRSIA